MESVADVLARCLRDHGIDTVFGIPGGENVEVLDALRRTGIRFVLVRHESSAVFMADVSARLTGRTAACLTTLGPGATNAVAGVAHAFLDRSPVLIITAQMSESMRPGQTHQFIDLAALMAPITKASIKLTPSCTEATIERAIELTRNGRPGPVHLQIANDDAAQPAGPGVSEELPPLEQIPIRQDLEAARSVIRRSHRPVIVTGLGLEPEKAYDALRRLCEAARAPVISTPKAKGSLPDDHPLAAGTIGLTSSDPAYRILDEADCILAVGLDVVELVKPWEQSAPLIWIAPWENRDPVLATNAEFVGPIAPVLEALRNVKWVTDRDWGEERVRKQREDLARQPLPAPQAGAILPQSVLRALWEAAPRDAILTTDVGSHKILAALTWPTYEPNSFFLSNGLSCMGYSLSAAIAASLSQPDRTVICTTGDAGLAMAMGELGTLAEVGAPVIVVVLNDGALDLIRSQQMRAGKPVYGTEFANPDFVLIAEAFGIPTCSVSEEHELRQVVERFMNSGKAALVEARIDPAGYPTTPRKDQIG